MTDDSMVQLAGFNLALAIGLFLLLWLVALRLRDVSFIDAFWALGMVVMAISSFLWVEGGVTRQVVLTGLCLVWGLRLGFHLFRRWRRDGVDKRYSNLFARLEPKGFGFARASLVFVFLPQSILMWLVSLPVQLGQFGATMGILAIIGCVMAIIGIAFETIGDAQLEVFRRNPENAGKVMDTGLWRYTRHPNYFGDFCVWWGLFLIAAEVPYGWLALPGPLFLSWTLMKWSGAPLLERGLAESRPGYADYVSRTSGFFPWLPKSSD
ncbi:MAG: membrane protein [Hyphobacterium sp.]|nr:MAG: membrane protein [Hyphobacterium sp.]